MNRVGWTRDPTDKVHAYCLQIQQLQLKEITWIPLKISFSHISKACVEDKKCLLWLIDQVIGFILYAVVFYRWLLATSYNDLWMYICCDQQMKDLCEQLICGGFVSRG